MPNSNKLASFDTLASLTIKDEHLRAALRGEEFLVLDGGMGSMLQAAGLLLPGAVPELLNFTHPDQIREIQHLYVEAGAEVITCNSFGANAKKLGGKAKVTDVFKAAAQIARDAGARYVAADLGPTGELLQPMGTLSFEDAYALFAEQVDAAVEAGCDLIIIETISDLLEAKAAVLAAKERSKLPIMVTMTFEEDGRTFLGTPPQVAAATLSSLGAQLVGMNCSLGPAEALEFAQTICRYSSVPVALQPNAGLPRMEDGKTVYDVTPEDFTAAMDKIIACGVSALGGCCGTTPAMIAKVKELTQRYGTPVKRSAIDACIITSAQEAVVLDAGTHDIAPIGERINPTGKPKLKEALRNNDLDYIVGEAVGQRDLGAKLLDVNVGLPELDEPAMLTAAVQKLQSTVTLPLVLDSSDCLAIERAARIYAGKPLINSVNGKQENLDAVLPIVAHYGCSVIGLCLNEDGIPPTAQERFAIAQRIVAEAARYGIPAHDVVIDCLTMAVATNQSEACAILDAIKLVKSHLGCRTCLGVSNISFGLPQRNFMSSSFLSAAFGAGLDLPIINPNAARYRDAVRCFQVINGQDSGAQGYIAHCTEHEDPYDCAGKANVDQELLEQGLALILQATGGNLDVTLQTSNATASTGTQSSPAASGQGAVPIPESLLSSKETVTQVQNMILAGRKDPVATLSEQLLKDHEPLELIDGIFIPTLDEVGARFDQGKFFLPQLMASAEAVKAGFDVVKAHMGDGEANEAPTNDRPVIMATVKGDIHDIGKNIVKMLLENYGFTVVDLGKDVEPQQIVDTAIKRNINLVGLSALMTTTVKNMEETIKLLAEQAPQVKVFVGGAVLTEDYASTIGATWYTKDAAASARVAEEFYAQG